VLLSKKRERAVPIEADFHGFEIDDHFVVGYGLDYDEHYRNLPYIGILNPEGQAKTPSPPRPLLDGVPWEEWQEEQVRVAAATIHNIGNAVTVARLTIDEIRTESGVREALELLHEEIWPEVERRLEDGTLIDFLTSDEVGCEYPQMVRSLLNHASAAYVRRRNGIIAVTTKMDHVASILEVHSRLTTAPAEPVGTSLDAVLDDASTLVRESCAKWKVELVQDRDRGLYVMTDRTLLTDALVNVLTNAIDAMRAEEDITLRGIRITTGLEGERAFCVISNTGPPVPAADQERIFDFGYSTKGVEGRGIGLHFCRRVIESHGGGLWYRPEPDGSPAFRIELCVPPGSNGSSGLCG
jgi:signal transduction histidine kinase